MRSLASAAILVALASACADGPVYDELAGESSTDDQPADGKADSAIDGAYTYYSIVRAATGTDYQLARLNRTTTTCADGSTATACAITDLDWSESGLTLPVQQQLFDASFAIVRGRFAHVTKDQVTAFRFVVTEGWTAMGPAVADGVYVRVKDNGIRCITAPCPSLGEQALNTSRSANIAAVDFSPAGLTDSDVDALNSAASDPAGFLMAGDRYAVHENGQIARGRTATAAFQRLVMPPLAPCVPAGCSRVVCSDNPALITTCQWKSEYACYKDATCERQDDGTCGWTETAELDACFASYH